MYTLVTLSTRVIGSLKGLLGDITLYGVNGGATVEATLNLVRRVCVTPITHGEGYVLAFAEDEYNLLYEYIDETLRQGDYGAVEERWLVELAQAVGVPGWGLPTVNLRGVCNNDYLD